MKNLSKGLITFLLIAGFLLLLFFWGMKSYNNLVSQEESVSSAWSQVENVYQRRADLIPNLVATVKGYAEHERETLEAVVNARSKATQTTIDPTNITAEKLQEFQAAQGELTNALNRLMVVVEKYPDLKANQNFLELQAQLEGTENRITVERQKFTETAKSYNTLIRQFPRNIIAGLFGFERKVYFEAQEGAQNAPKVEF
ncbi:MAG: LemA family protein [Bacteroidales bacterium]|nr:LemA family protein [Bacteroidales bacterium]MDD2425367.1 LemA family protein [Bacteroidales bacterium]MDD3988784.1 LemA family protein [Bacteroidales bacterium]MDD4638889.1 LemA family protein [Bacteroidales bacterium]